MLFRSLGNQQSLGAFLRSLDSSTVMFRGNGFFEAICAAHVCLSATRSGRRCCLHVPNIDGDLRDLLISSGCATSEPVDVQLEFYQDEDVSGKMETYCRGWSTIMAGWKGDQEVLAYWMRPDFQPPKPMWESTMTRIQRKMVPFSWGGLQSGKFCGVFTTDWRMRFAMHLMGIPAFLISGPSWPQGMFKAYGISPASCIAIYDNARMRACPCPSPKVCHAMTAESKPCWSAKILDTSLVAFARQVSK